MLGTKVEIKLKKAEPGTWSKLDFPRVAPQLEQKGDSKESIEEDDSVDLSTVEAIQSIGQINVAG